MTKTIDEMATDLRGFYRQYSASKGADRSAFTALCADNVRMEVVGGEQPEADYLAPTIRKADVDAYFDSMFTHWNMDRFDVVDVVASGDKVVVLSEVSFTAKATGKTAHTEKSDVFTVKDGEIVAVMEFFDTAGFRDALMA